MIRLVVIIGACALVGAITQPWVGLALFPLGVTRMYR